MNKKYFLLIISFISMKGISQTPIDEIVSAVGLDTHGPRGFGGGASC